ncbi:cyclin-dependent kinase inhibitor 3 [Cynara cardunculus var. scolymus]|uniref:Cyclin-dependent kinase inhibitor n=1 Tax=Cynara cardunculus var. scolymus TaxID=59895 RepID=A0A103YNJ4_CYNCS|nr:cyclin-dependent kinase inhibitor 3 [Cynara cardunculus var. scolymus]KVI12307.1 Cyclin-dependent kinase inhibitor [Cynara cardunculus var. scolymus]
MGRYMRKAKLTVDVVAVMDVSQSSLGVRTRAKTLALQKLEASKTATTPPPPEQNSELSYLQLRSRRLEKPPLQQSTCYRQQNPNPRVGGLRLAIRSGGSVSVGSGSSNERVRVLDESQFEADEDTEANCDLGSEETSFGENNIDFDGRKRSTRESTPCSYIRDLNASSTPGSSTRPKTSNWVIQRSMPAAQEIEGFFARHAQEQQRRFSEKYNFDIVNEKPLEGRYEWVRVQP